MTLLREIQRLLEQTYAPSGVNLEECVIGKHRCDELSRISNAEGLSPIARTFIRQEGNRLHIAIFYAQPLIEQLEGNDPRLSLNPENVAALAQFVEEIDHGLQAALLFQENCFPDNERELVLNLEVQAKVDTFLVLAKFAHCHCKEPLTPESRRWLVDQIFDRSYKQFQDRVLRMRYRITQAVARRFLAYLKTLPLKRRRAALCRFRKLKWREKLAFCRTHRVKKKITD